MCSRFNGVTFTRYGQSDLSSNPGNESFHISLSVNILEKVTNPTILPPAMDN